MENIKIHQLKSTKDEHILNILKKSRSSTEGYFDIVEENTENSLDIVGDFLENINNEVDIFYIKLFDTLICVEQNEIKSVNIPSKEINTYSLPELVDKASWNGTHMILAVLYKSNKIETFTLDKFGKPRSIGQNEIAAEVPNRKNVGWGSQTKQFQGKKLKQESIDQNKLCFKLNKENYISWNHKHEQFLISYYQEDSGRTFKIFNEKCAPLHKSDFVKGEILGPVSWKPQGNNIACSVLKDNHNAIALFEPNGMYRKSFNLIDILYPVTELKWSPCGKILSVVQKNYVSLYTTKNNCWYLKQCLIFNDLRSIHWVYAFECCPVLLVNTKNELVKYTFKFEVDFCSPEKIALINGTTLSCINWENTSTDDDFGEVIVRNDSPINIVTFNQKNNECSIIDYKNKIMIYKNCDTLEWNLIFAMENPDFKLQIHHFIYFLQNPCFIKESMNGFEIIYLENNQLKVLKENLNDPIEHLLPLDDNLIIQTSNKRFDIKNTFNQDINSSILLSNYRLNNENYYFELNDKNELLIDGINICYPVNSFLIHDKFLFFIKEQDVYSSILNEETIEKLKNNKNALNIRPLNQNGSIVGLLPQAAKLVVQIHRGDIEFVSCKLMEIAYVESLICENNWKNVIDFVRMNRLNWNLLIDLNFDRFYDNIENILDYCNSNVLTSFTGEITDDNILSTIYASCNYGKVQIVENKKKKILTKFLNYLENKGICHFVSITVKICMEHYDISKALFYILHLLSEKGHVTCFCKGRKDWENKAMQGVNVIRKYHVDNVKIYHEALLLLDINLAEFVATHCQLDPLSFEPYLKTLNNLPILQQRFKIYHDLNLYSKAFPYLIRFENNAQIISAYVIKNSIYKEAFAVCEINKPSFLIDVAKLYAKKLSSDRKHNEAVVIYLRFKLYDLAVNETISALDYKTLLKILPFTSFNENDHNIFIGKMAKVLENNGKSKEAAMIYKVYLKDVRKAVKVLLDKKYFKEAFLYLSPEDEGILNDILLPELLKELDNIKIYFDESLSIFRQHFKRLLEVREERLKLETIFGNNYDDSQSEIYSDTSSTTFKSKNSSSSVITSASRRKQLKLEKKKRDLSKGSKFEDVALIIALYELTNNVFNFGENLNNLLFVATSVGSIPFFVVKNLQGQLYSIQKEIENAIPKIWLEDAPVCYHLEYLDEIYRKAPQLKNGYIWMLDILK